MKRGERSAANRRRCCATCAYRVIMDGCGRARTRTTSSRFSIRHIDRWVRSARSRSAGLRQLVGRPRPGLFFPQCQSGPASAGMPFTIFPHMLRHACGYALANAGHDTRALQAWLGHKNIQHTVRYTELAPRSEEHTSELQSLTNLVCRLLLE